MADEEQVDFQFLAENSADIICRVDPGTNKLTYVSPSSLRILGWAPEEMLGTGPEELVFPEDLPALFEAVARAHGSDQETDSVTVRVRRKDGSTVWMEMNARLVRDSAGVILEIVTAMRDVSERKALEDKLAAMAMTDGLTGIANRRAFDEALEREWKRTLREGSQISLLLLDLDHFKEFNDRYGHQFGDDCLRAVAAAVAGAVRETDLVARYGGEEIAIILPATGSAGALETAEKVRAAVEGLRITHEGNPDAGGWVTASIGVATALARDGGTMRMPESLLLSADHALYKAKNEGRNRLATTLLMAPKD